MFFRNPIFSAFTPASLRLPLPPRHPRDLAIPGLPRGESGS